eukprot:3922781-Rhodomonas_salina.2
MICLNVRVLRKAVPVSLSIPTPFPVLHAMIAPSTSATPALAGLMTARGGATALNMGSGYFLRPDGSRQRYSAPAPSYQPPAPAYQPPAPQYNAPPPAYQPAAPAYQPAPAASYTPPAGAPAQNAGDLPPSGWGGETKAHSRDPTPTQLDPNDPKAKQTHIPVSESFEEYMRRRQQGF